MRTSKTSDGLLTLIKAGIPIGDIYDVGVLHGTPVLMELFHDRTHHLFEPIDDYFNEIKTNYRKINHKLVHAAVSDKTGKAFVHSAKKLGDGHISHSWISDIPTDSSRMVPEITLDQYSISATYKAPLLLKIDVDGAAVPASILRGAKNTLAGCSVVIIEITLERWFERAEILHHAGFDLWDVTSLCYYGDCLWQFDAIFVSRKFKIQYPNLSPMHQLPFDMKRWQQG